MTTCFVTVGTTRFDELINEVLTDSCLDALRLVGINSVLLQIGSGEWKENIKQRVFGGFSADEGEGELCGIHIRYYRYKPSIMEDIENSMIVIGHAGAGTCLECLKLRLPLIVVINEKLMDNHQLELASHLASGNHLLYCTLSRLCETISRPNLFSLVPFNPPNHRKVAKFIDERLGLKKSE